MRILRKKKNEKGFTLVELMIVVAIIGILAVLAIYGVSRYMTNAKTGEARNALGQIAKGGVAAYEEERSDSTLIEAGKSGAAALNDVCASATNTVPSDIAAVSNRKYQSNAAPNEDWQKGDRNTGWPCLKFSLTEPQYFMYGYQATSGKGFNAFAEADFKGSGKATHGFSIQAVIDGTTKQITVSPQIDEAEGAAKYRTAP